MCDWFNLYEEAVQNHPDVFGKTRIIFELCHDSQCLLGARGRVIRQAPQYESEEIIRDRIERSISCGKNLFRTEWMKPTKLRTDVTY